MLILIFKSKSRYSSSTEGCYCCLEINRDGHPNKKEEFDGKSGKLNWISLYFNNENLSTYIYTIFF